MMKSTEILIKEHHLIHRYLDLLSQYKQALEKGKKPNAEFFRQAIRFSRTYADQFHHFKEEYVMFGLLAQKKEGELDGQIGELRYQHERCRHCIIEIEKSIQKENQIDEMRITNLLEHLSGYISLLKRHIYLEDHIFFPLAQKSLSKEDDEYLLNQFKNQEKSMENPDFKYAMQSLVEQMAAIIDEP